MARRVVNRLCKIIANPLEGMADREVAITIEGLSPYQKVTFHSFTVPNRTKSFEAVSHYISNREGCIDLCTESSLGGSYKGIHPMGFIWSMKPSVKNPYARFFKFDVTDPMIVKLNVYDGFIQDIQEMDRFRSDGTLEKLSLASLNIKRLYMQPGTERKVLTIGTDGVHGTLFIPPGDGPFPCTITMFGSHPGTFDFKASLLASHGYASLALAYHGVDGLPRMGASWPLGIDFDMIYLDKVIEFLCQHPKVSSEQGFAVLGISSSVPLALLCAVHINKIKCVVFVTDKLI